MTKKNKPEGFTALHRGFRHKVWYGFRDGASTLRLRRKYSLTQTVVEEIIREHKKSA
jgi:Mor family transcriptional regulator